MFVDIPDYEDIYQISPLGEILSSHQSSPIKGWVESTGYRAVSLRKEGIRKNICVHVLLAKIFIPNPKNLPEVNHKDGNKLNNSLHNLEWVAYVDNIRHAFSTGLTKHPACIDYTKIPTLLEEVINGITLRDICLRENMKETSSLRKLLLREAIRIGRESEFRQGTLKGRKAITTERSVKVIQKCISGLLVQEHASINEAARSVGKNPASIWKAINKQKLYLGFRWEQSSA